MKLAASPPAGAVLLRSYGSDRTLHDVERDAELVALLGFSPAVVLGDVPIPRVGQPLAPVAVAFQLYRHQTDDEERAAIAARLHPARDNFRAIGRAVITEAGTIALLTLEADVDDGDYIAERIAERDDAPGVPEFAE